VFEDAAKADVKLTLFGTAKITGFDRSDELGLLKNAVRGSVMGLAGRLE
jgi:hypothetical protein